MQSRDTVDLKAVWVHVTLPPKAELSDSPAFSLWLPLTLLGILQLNVLELLGRVLYDSPSRFPSSVSSQLSTILQYSSCT